MTTVADWVRRLMPEGTRDSRVADWKECPAWPPDVFAVAATLINITGCYAQPSFSAYTAPDYYFDEEYISEVERLGEDWLVTGIVSAELAKLWQELVVVHGDKRVAASGASALQWQRIAMKLLAISDAASGGIGFCSQEGYDVPFPWLFRIEHLRVAKEVRDPAAKHSPPILPHIPGSICQRVPPQEATVLPKSLAAQIGCTLRSLSHNLALLPAEGIVAATWMLGQHTRKDSEREKPNGSMNFLLVPFPYKINGECFKAMRHPRWNKETRHEHHNFTIDQQWLDDLTPEALADDLVLPLLREARKEVGRVHGVVFPEGALNPRLAKGLARQLADDPYVELFVSGVLDKPRTGLAENRAVTFYYDGDRIATSWEQKKSHRWALDERQIQQYHLGHVLEPKNRTWWECIDVSDRKVAFTVIGQGAVVAVMICEDLARFDPAHPVVRSVGPNLLIALLMDGPQLKNRWPCRYATVLADDPGTAVLTLTSAGMARRSCVPGTDQPKQVGLWKHPGGDAIELVLPSNDHGLVLTLSLHGDEQFTLDQRGDGGVTRRFELSGTRSVRLPRCSRATSHRFGLN